MLIRFIAPDTARQFGRSCHCQYTLESLSAGAPRQGFKAMQPLAEAAIQAALGGK